MNNKRILGIILILVIGCFFFIKADNSITGNTALVDGQSIKIPLSEITNDLQRYSLSVDGVAVTYFTALDSTGKVKTAFDACDVCGGRKGYKQKDTDVICNNCGRMFSINDLGVKNKGGRCWPSYLSHTIKNGYIVISKTEIEGGAFKF